MGGGCVQQGLPHETADEILQSQKSENQTDRDHIKAARSKNGSFRIFQSESGMIVEDQKNAEHRERSERHANNEKDVELGGKCIEYISVRHVGEKSPLQKHRLFVTDEEEE